MRSRAIGWCLLLALPAGVVGVPAAARADSVQPLSRAWLKVARIPPLALEGASLAGAGDVNGDGRADLIVGSGAASPGGRFRAGSAYVVFGRSALGTIGLDTFGGDGFRIDGAPPALDVEIDRTGPVGEKAGSAAAGVGDVNGDGLADVVHVRNGSCTYWPNLGYGLFGERVVMQDTPLLDHPEKFDPRRVQLADFDGTGTGDLIYFSSEGIRILPNLAGNRFGAEVRLPLFLPGSIAVTDLWGRGTASVVWSSSEPREADRNVRVVDLFPEKPHLLRKVENGHGLTTQIRFTFTVTNVAPTAGLINDGPVLAGNPVTITFTDPSDISPADGAVVWLRSWGGDANDRASAIAVDSAGAVDVADEEEEAEEKPSKEKE